MATDAAAVPYIGLLPEGSGEWTDPDTGQHHSWARPQDMPRKLRRLLVGKAVVRLGAEESPKGAH